VSAEIAPLEGWEETPCLECGGMPTENVGDDDGNLVVTCSNSECPMSIRGTSYMFWPVSLKDWNAAAKIKP
jgi:hypothetical protein